jgi:hypothetical protein
MSGKTGTPSRPGERPANVPEGGDRGINFGTTGPHPERDSPPTAYDVKDLHRRLKDFPDDVLKQISILPPGSRLEEGGVYIDLHAPEPREFRASGVVVAGPDNWYVPKELVHYELWNKLIGVTDPYRTGEGNSS